MMKSNDGLLVEVPQNRGELHHQSIHHVEALSSSRKTIRSPFFINVKHIE